MREAKLLAGWDPRSARLVKDLWPHFERSGVDFYPVVTERNEREVRVRWSGTAKPVIAIFTNLPSNGAIWLKLTVGDENKWYTPVGLLTRSKRDSEVKKRQRGRVKFAAGGVPDRLDLYIEQAFKFCPRPPIKGSRSTATAKYVTPAPGGGWRVADTRVSLASVLHAYRAGRSPEAVAADFPSLTLEHIHGVIAYYLQNRDAVDRHLAELDAEWDRLRAAAAGPDPLRDRLRAAARVRP